MIPTQNERARCTAILRAPGAEKMPRVAALLIDAGASVETAARLLATATGTDGRFSHLRGAGGDGLESWAERHRAASGGDVSSPAAAVAMARRGMPHLFIVNGGR
jgi:hypothetical protein